MQVQQLVGTNWREAKAATLQVIPLRPGGLPGVIMVAGLRQAHLVSHQGHTMASLPLAVISCLCGWEAGLFVGASVMFGIAASLLDLASVSCYSSSAGGDLAMREMGLNPASLCAATRACKALLPDQVSQSGGGGGADL